MAFIPVNTIDTLERIGKITDPQTARQVAKQEKARKMASNLTKKFINTQIILSKKIEELSKLAVRDDSTQALIDAYEKSKTANIEDIMKRVTGEGAVSGEEMEQLIDAQTGLLSAVEGSNAILEVNFNDLINMYSKQLMNEDISGEERKAILDELSRFASGIESSKDFEGSQLEALRSIESLSRRGVDLNLEQAQKLQATLNELKDDDIVSFKMKGTLDDINRIVESIMIDNKELNENLEKNMGDGSLKDVLSSMGLGEVGTTVKGGIIDMLLSTLGLGGLGVGDALAKDGIISSVKKVFTGIKESVVNFFEGIKNFFVRVKNFFANIYGKASKIFSTVTAPITKIFGKVSAFGTKIGGFFTKISGFIKSISSTFSSVSSVTKVATPFLSKIGKFLGPLAIIFTALEGIYYFINAADIAGKAEEAVTFFDRINAMLSGLISSLSFGLIDPKELFSKIDAAAQWVSDFASSIVSGLPTISLEEIGSIMSGAKDGFLKMITDTWDVISKSTTDFVVSLWETIKDFFGVAIKNSLTTLGSNIFGGVFGDKSDTGDDTSKKETKGSFFSNLFGMGDDSGVQTATGVQTRDGFDAGQTQGLPPSKLIEAMAAKEKERNEVLRDIGKSTSASARAVIAPIPVGKSTRTVNKSTSIDDYGVAFANSLVFGS